MKKAVLLKKMDLENPFQISAIVILLALLIIIVGMLISITGFIDISPSFPWTVSSSMVFFLAMILSITILKTKNIDKFMGRSILSFIITVIITGLIAYLFSGEIDNKTKIYKTIYTVISFGFLVLISILSFIKRIVNYAEKETWEAPRKK